MNEQRLGVYVPCERHDMAILHMVGQFDTIRLMGSTVSDIADVMNRSKPTAQKHLDRLVEAGMLNKTKYKFGAHGRWHYWLTEKSGMMFEAGEFREAYRLYVQRVMGIII